jgi:mRNA-degrading endonuclease RelE of RelBE toxin-antitoxin system
MTDQSNVEVVVAVTFIRNLRLLAKKYRSIHKDIQPVIEELENGAIVGEQVPNIGYAVFKVRVRNRDVQKAKAVVIG